MTQPTLFDVNPSGLTEMSKPPPRARATDPETSHIAASRAVRFAGSHAAQIVAILRETQGALTTHEIATRSAQKLSNSQVHHRTAELKAAKKIDNGPERTCRCNRKGLSTCDGTQPMQTWRAL